MKTISWADTHKAKLAEWEKGKVKVGRQTYVNTCIKHHNKHKEEKTTTHHGPSQPYNYWPKETKDL